MQMTTFDLIIYWGGGLFVSIILFIPLYIKIKFDIKRKKYANKYKFYKKIGLDPKHIFKGGFAFPIGFKIKDGRIIYSGFY